MKVLVVTSDYEGFGSPVLDAEGCGTPAITRKGVRISSEVAVVSARVGSPPGTRRGARRGAR